MPEARIRIQSPSLAVAFAALIRDVRSTIGWTQDELADRAGLSQSKIWRMESGMPGSLDLDSLDRVLAALGLRCSVDVEGRHLTERRDQLDLVHAQLNGALAGRLKRAGWMGATEVQIGDPTPRGWIDLLGWRPADASLLLVETKTDIPDVGGLQRQVGWYAREAARVASRLGWRPHAVVVAVICLDSEAVAHRLVSARLALREAFPGDPRDLERWLDDPKATRPRTWTLATTDLRSRRGIGLRSTVLRGRRRTAAYRNYADAAKRCPT